SAWMPMGDAHTYVQNAENDPRPLLRDIANGLYYLHSHELGPVVHGNLKGPNVLVSSDRRALLSDFGLSTLNESTFSMTTVAIRGGSRRWMAPELFNDCPASKESDMWAYGMTILELFTRSIPFHDCRHDASFMRRIVEGNLPARPAGESTQFRLSDAWWEICMSCWKKDPSSRPTIKQVKATIHQADPPSRPLPPGDDSAHGPRGESGAMVMLQRQNHEKGGFFGGFMDMMMRLTGWYRWSKKTTAISPTDHVVFIVGSSGSGKSRFMDILLRNPSVHVVRANRGQRPATTDVYTERCRFEGMPTDIVLVDMPSFHAYEGPDGEEIVKKWMDSKYMNQCKRAGILYMHNIASNPHDSALGVSIHLETFRRTLPRNLTINTVHIVPTILFAAKFTVERINALMARLQSQADGVGATMSKMPFDGRPETAWDVMQELLNRYGPC
ncbi:hypothetical protein M404DRAFT_1009280, partial [Pisolithus tinctorius Marx 270]